MTNRTQIFARQYSSGRPFVTIRIAIVNPNTYQRTAFDQKCWVDTGFDGGVHVPEFRRSEANMAGIQPIPTTVTLAGGLRRPGYVCLAFLQQIEDYEVPLPGLEMELLMQGDQRWGLIGLEVLRNWIAEFDGPREILNVYK